MQTNWFFHSGRHQLRHYQAGENVPIYLLPAPYKEVQRHVDTELDSNSLRGCTVKAAQFSTEKQFLFTMVFQEEYVNILCLAGRQFNLSECGKDRHASLDFVFIFL